MHITWRELAIDPPSQAADDLLAAWRWMVPSSLQLRMVSSMGDAFLEHPEGGIYWLDVAAAELTEVADNIEEFHKLRQQPEHADEWFAPQLIGEMLATGSTLAEGQCFSYKVPPTLGGSFAPENLEPCSLSVHFAALGKIQSQVKSLPLGAKIESVKLEE